MRCGRTAQEVQPQIPRFPGRWRRFARHHTKRARCLDAGAPRPRAHRLVPRNRRGRGTVGPNRLGRLGRNGDTGVLGRSCEQKTRRRRGQPGEQGQQRDGKPTAFPPCERLVSWHGTSPWQWRGPRRGAGHARRASLHYTCSFSVALPRVGVLRSRCPAIVTTRSRGLRSPPTWDRGYRGSPALPAVLPDGRWPNGRGSPHSRRFHDHWVFLAGRMQLAIEEGERPRAGIGPGPTGVGDVRQLRVDHLYLGGVQRFNQAP
jgi:hypothetical protein